MTVAVKKKRKGGKEESDTDFFITKHEGSQEGESGGGGDGESEGIGEENYGG